MRALFNILLNLLLKKSTFTSSLSSGTAPESLTRGIYDREDQWHVLVLREGNPHSHKEPVTLTHVKVWVRIEYSTSILPSQDDDPMVKYIEIEALSEVSPEIRLEEVVSLFEEIPGVVQLDASQLRKLVRLILGAESVVNGCGYQDGSRANSTSDELVVLAGDGGQVGGVEGRHGVAIRGDGRWHENLSMSSRVG